MSLVRSIAKVIGSAPCSNALVTSSLTTTSVYGFDAPNDRNDCLAILGAEVGWECHHDRHARSVPGSPGVVRAWRSWRPVARTECRADTPEPPDAAHLVAVVARRGCVSRSDCRAQECAVSRCGHQRAARPRRAAQPHPHRDTARLEREP